MHVYAMRHGESENNVLGIWNYDPDKDFWLTKNGIAQARDIAVRLKGSGIQRIFMSEFPRVQQTALIANRYLDVPLIIEPRLNERISGCEGGSVKEFYDLHEHKLRDLFTFKPENGESYQEEKTRIYSFLDELVQLPLEKVLLVTHGEPLRVVASYFTRCTDEETLRIPIPNCALYEYNRLRTR